MQTKDGRRLTNCKVKFALVLRNVKQT